MNVFPNPRVFIARGLGVSKKLLSLTFERVNTSLSCADAAVVAADAVAAAADAGLMKHAGMINLDNASDLDVIGRSDCNDADAGTEAETSSSGVTVSETPLLPLEKNSSPLSSLSVPLALTPAESVQLWMTDSEALRGLRVVCAIVFVYLSYVSRRIFNHCCFAIRSQPLLLCYP